MSIKLNAQSGGSVALDAPTQTTSSADLVFKLPVADGSSGQVLKTDGSKNLSFGAAGNSNSMQVLEEFCSPCDGSVITLSDGTHTLSQPVKVDVSDTFTDIVGSSFTYTPPTGTVQVIYDFRVFVSNDGGTDEPILSFKLMLDSNEVIRFRRVFRGDSTEQELSLKWSFNIGGSADTNVGRVASWTSDKTIKLQVDRYSSNYPGVLHETNHWGNQGSTDMLALPTLHVKAIGSV